MGAKTEDLQMQRQWRITLDSERNSYAQCSIDASDEIAHRAASVGTIKRFPEFIRYLHVAEHVQRVGVEADVFPLRRRRYDNSDIADHIDQTLKHRTSTPDDARQPPRSSRPWFCRLWL